MRQQYNPYGEGLGVETTSRYVIIIYQKKCMCKNVNDVDSKVLVVRVKPVQAAQCIVLSEDGL